MEANKLNRVLTIAKMTMANSLPISQRKFHCAQILYDFTDVQKGREAEKFSPVFILAFKDALLVVVLQIQSFDIHIWIYFSLWRLGSILRRIGIFNCTCNLVAKYYLNITKTQQKVLPSTVIRSGKYMTCYPDFLSLST